MLAEHLQVNSKVTHQAGLQTIIVEMVHIRDMGYSLWILITVEERDKRGANIFALRTAWWREPHSTVAHLRRRIELGDT